jgi:hypothetical protein
MPTTMLSSFHFTGPLAVTPALVSVYRHICNGKAAGAAPQIHTVHRGAAGGLAYVELVELQRHRGVLV